MSQFVAWRRCVCASLKTAGDAANAYRARCGASGARLLLVGPRWYLSGGIGSDILSLCLSARFVASSAAAKAGGCASSRDRKAEAKAAVGAACPPALPRNMCASERLIGKKNTGCSGAIISVYVAHCVCIVANLTNTENLVGGIFGVYFLFVFCLFGSTPSLSGQTNITRGRNPDGNPPRPASPCPRPPRHEFQVAPEGLR
jgi:hypothetical protein